MLYKKRWNKNNITLIYIMAFNALGDVESGVLLVCDDSEDLKIRIELETSMRLRKHNNTGVEWKERPRKYVRRDIQPVMNLMSFSDKLSNRT